MSALLTHAPPLGLAPGLMIKDTILGAMLDVEDVELEDCPWFVDHFPGDIPMSCVTET